jgi:hypothetical protein
MNIRAERNRVQDGFQELRAAHLEAVGPHKTELVLGQAQICRLSAVSDQHRRAKWEQ